MKKAIQYLFSVLLSLLLIFSLLGTAGTLLLDKKALNPDTCKELIRTQNLPSRISTSMNAYFTQQENTTGITAKTYENSIAPLQLEKLMTAYIENGFAYLNGEAETIGITADFSAMEKDLTEFFNQYAEDNHCAKDAVFEKALADSIASAEESILISTDVFRFMTLDDAGVMAKAKKVMPYIPKLEIACIAADVILLALLILVHRKALRGSIYWLANAIFGASVILVLPTAWINYTNWFDRFAVKSEQIFAAVTGYLYGMTNAAMTVGICGIVLAVLLWILQAFMASRTKRNESNASTKDAKAH